MPNEHLVETVRGVIEWAALGIEVLGALVIVAAVIPGDVMGIGYSG